MDSAENATTRIGTALASMVIVVLVTACGLNAAAITTTHTIHVYFNEVGCPTDIDEKSKELYVRRTDQVVWQSVPKNMKYRVWLVPFTGGILSPASSRNPNSDSTGKASVTFSEHAPYGPTVGGENGVRYEYTIQSMGTDGQPCLPLDPHIRVG